MYALLFNKTKKANVNNGFTLVEIMVILAIVLILTAISIPNLLRARIQANESLTMASLRSIHSAMTSYFISNSSYAGLTLLGLSVALPPYIDNNLANGIKQGYTFILTVINDTQYWVSALPTHQGITGVRRFYIDEQGQICVGVDIPADHAAAGESCPPNLQPTQ